MTRWMKKPWESNRGPWSMITSLNKDKESLSENILTCRCLSQQGSLSFKERSSLLQINWGSSQLYKNLHLLEEVKSLCSPWYMGLGEGLQAEVIERTLSLKSFLWEPPAANAQGLSLWEMELRHACPTHPISWL